MGNLVDTRLPRLRRVALPNRKQHKHRPRILEVNAEYRSPATAWLRDVVLYASAELGPVARFGLAGAEGISSDAIDLKLADRRLYRCSCCLARAPQILGQSLLVNAQPKTGARPVAD